MAPPNGAQRGGMSSRLASMKFMQRAAASESSAPSTPAEPAAKKQRLSNGSVRSAPASTPRSEVQSPADADEARREETFAREAAARGDTKWYLSFKEPQAPAVSSSLRIVSAGYGALDSSTNRDHSSDGEGDTGRPQMAGRRSFGNFGKEKQRQAASDSDSSSGSESSDSEEDDDSDDPSGVNALIAAERKQAGDRARAERKAKKAADRADAARMADERRKKEVNLNNVTSISGFGGGGSGTRKPQNLKETECFRCGGKGHLKVDCPQKNGSRRK